VVRFNWEMVPAAGGAAAAGALSSLRRYSLSHTVSSWLFR
jgi:hypothetical protein